MPYLILSDIHANLEAHQAVLEDARGKYDRILCLGDLVGYGADPNAIVEWTRENVTAVIRGNHDRVSVGSDPGEPDGIDTFQSRGAGFHAVDAQCAAAGKPRVPGAFAARTAAV